MRRQLAALNAGLCALALKVAAVLLAAGFAVVILQIFSRTLFSYSFVWSEIVSRSCMAWSAFLAAPTGYRAGKSVAVSFFRENFPPFFARAGAGVVALLIFATSVIFVDEGIAMTARGMQVQAAGLPAPVGVLYAILPVSFAMFALISAEHAFAALFDDIAGRKDPYT